MPKYRKRTQREYAKRSRPQPPTVAGAFGVTDAFLEKLFGSGTAGPAGQAIHQAIRVADHTAAELHSIIDLFNTKTFNELHPEPEAPPAHTITLKKNKDGSFG